MLKATCAEELTDADRERIREIDAKLHLIGKATMAEKNYLPSVAAGTPQWQAWRHWRLENDMPIWFMDQRPRWTVVSEWPPTDLDAAVDAAKSKTRQGLSGDARKRLEGRAA